MAPTPAAPTPTFTPAGAPAPLRGGGTSGRGHGRTTRSFRGKSGRVTRDWLSAITLPWETSFLPRVAREGYDAQEIPFNDAILGHGGSSAWSLERRPTLVMIYNSRLRRDTMTSLNLDKDPRFIAASRYCDLRKVDVRTINNKKAAKEYQPGGTLLLFCGQRHRMVSLHGPKLSATAVLPYLIDLIEHEFGTSGHEAIARMQVLLARRAELKAQATAQELKLFSARTGKIDRKVAKRLRGIQQELETLKETETAMINAKRAGRCASGR